MKFDFLTTYWPFYIEGLKITIIYSVFAVIFGIILGVALALMKISKLKLFKAFAVSYINFVRGTPILVQIYIVLVCSASGLILQILQRVSLHLQSTVALMWQKLCVQVLRLWIRGRLRQQDH